jgi:hypothetical protein
VSLFSRLFTPPGFVPAQQVISKSKHPQRVLAFARVLIADRRRWTTGVAARRASGTECSPHDPDAVCFCAYGAIDACATTDAARREAEELLARVICPEPKTLGDTLPCSVISRVNDRKGHKATLAAFDECLRRGV